MNLTTRLKIDLAFAFALLILVLVGVVSYRSLHRMRADQGWVVHTEQVLRQLEGVASSVKDAETAQRGYLLTQRERFLGPYLAARPSIRSKVDTLRHLLRDYPYHQHQLSQLDSLIARKLVSLDRTVEMGRRGEFAQAEDIVRQGAGQELMDSIRSTVRALADEEFDLLRDRNASEAASARDAVLLVAMGSFMAVLVVGLSRQRIVRDLRAREVAERTLAASEESVRELYRIASSQELDYTEKIRALLVMGSERFGVRIGVLAHIHADMFEVMEAVGLEERLWPGRVISLADTYCAETIRGREPVAFHHAARTEWAKHDCYAIFGLEAYLGVPVVVEGQPYGVVFFGDTRPRPVPFTQSEQDFLRLMAQWIGGEIERYRAEQALRQREEGFRVLVETASDLIFTTDSTGRFTYVNPVAVQTVGYSRGELLGMHPLDLVREDWRDRARAFYEEQYQKLVPTTYFELPIVAKDGREIWLGQNLQIILERGRPVGGQVVARDITKQYEMERMKDEFLSVVSHELRTPLTAIRGSLGLLASGKLGTLETRGQHMLEIASQNTDRLVRLINELLDIEKIESGTASMQKQAVAAGELVEQAVEVMRPMAEKEELTLEVTPVAAGRLWVDPDRVVQVLTNLLSNAIKFSSPGGVVRLRAEACGAEVLFCVSDQGRGIPADKLEVIFDRFQQVDSSDARQKGGSGLGLSIARSIIQQHGGRMWVESVWGQGSSFYFTLPLLVEAEPQRKEEGARVLVCDDDPGVRALVREILQREGYSVVLAESGVATLQAAREQLPAVILLDLNLPGMDGYEVISALRKNPDTRSVPIVVLTGYGDEGTIDPAEVMGWVEKPIDQEMLLTLVEWAVNRRAEHYDVLLVEDDPDLAGVIQEMLHGHGMSCRVASSGESAIDLSRRISYGLMILDPGLPDVDGYAVVAWLRRHHRHREVPLIVYSARDLSESERDQLRLGPSEFITKTRTPVDHLERSVLEMFRRNPGARESVGE